MVKYLGTILIKRKTLSFHTFYFHLIVNKLIQLVKPANMLASKHHHCLPWRKTFLMRIYSLRLHILDGEGVKSKRLHVKVEQTSVSGLCLKQQFAREN